MPDGQTISDLRQALIDANVHDSQALPVLVEKGDRVVYADCFAPPHGAHPPLRCGSLWLAVSLRSAALITPLL